MHLKSTSGALTEGAMMAALAALLALIGVYLPPLRLVTDVMWIVPVVILIIRHNLRAGVISLIVAALLVMMLSNPIQAGFLVLQFGPLGLLYGVLIKRQATPGKIILSGSLAAAASQLILLVVMSRFAGFSPAAVEAGMISQVDSTLRFYDSVGLTGQYAGLGIDQEMLKESMIQMINWIKILLPGILVAASIFTALLSYLAVIIVLRRLRYAIKALPPFREWQLPWYCAWGVIAALGLYLAGDYFNWEIIATVGKNILFVYLPFLLVFGAAVVVYFNKKWKIPLIIKIVVIALAVLNMSFALAAVVTLGLFDSLLNYRKLTSQKTQ